LVLVGEGLSYAEIAVATATKEGTVAWRISAAREQLTTLLEGGKNAATG
jgi:DNA-directed RNA polymerase specialized sigma24 family protein